MLFPAKKKNNKRRLPSEIMINIQGKGNSVTNLLNVFNIILAINGILQARKKT